LKVLVVNNMAPFTWGGAEELGVHLQRALVDAGHEAEVLRIPFQWEPAGRIPSQMLMVMGLELQNVDRVIALKFPAYLIRHPHKTLWLLHQYRQAYDLYGAGMSNLPSGPEGEEIRRLIMNADGETFRMTRRIYVNSDVTRDRLARYSGVRAEILRPPLNDPELFTGGESEGYVFAGGRINAMKRQHLVLEALAKAPRDVRLVIAGPPDGPDDATRLRRLVESMDLTDRVKLDLRFLPRTELANYVNHATAVAYLPFDEDSLGYVAMEGAAAGKPLITTNDSGGVLSLVRHLQTGFVAQANPESLAEGLQRFGVESAATLEIGAAARTVWTGLELTWPHAVDRLLA
jgi:glycosyltransferase involved in cell wall biosynthesis